MRLFLMLLAALAMSAPAYAEPDICWLESVKADGAGVKVVFRKQYNVWVSKADSRSLGYSRDFKTGLYEEKDAEDKILRVDLDGIPSDLHDTGSIMSSPENTCSFAVETDNGRIGLKFSAAFIPYINGQPQSNTSRQFVPASSQE